MRKTSFCVCSKISINFFLISAHIVFCAHAARIHSRSKTGWLSLSYQVPAATHRHRSHSRASLRHIPSTLYGSGGEDDFSGDEDDDGISDDSGDSNESGKDTEEDLIAPVLARPHLGIICTWYVCSNFAKYVTAHPSKIQ